MMSVPQKKMHLVGSLLAVGGAAGHSSLIERVDLGVNT